MHACSLIGLSIPIKIHQGQHAIATLNYLKA